MLKRTMEYIEKNKKDFIREQKIKEHWDFVLKEYKKIAEKCGTHLTEREIGLMELIFLNGYELGMEEAYEDVSNIIHKTTK